MKVFISGPMSGKPNFNREAFFKAQEELEKLGYSVWNPAWLAYPSDTEFSKDDMHDIDIEALKHCDVIYMLKGWQDSKGALAEYAIAKKKGLSTMYEDPSYFGTLYKHSRIAKPINDCYSIYDYIGPNKIDSLEKQCNDLAEDIKGIKGDVEGQDRRLDCHNNRLMSLTERVDTLSKQKNPFADRIDALEDEVEDIKKSIGTDNLKEQLDKDFDDVYEEFENTKDKVNDIEFGYINWSSKMSSAIDEMEKVKETVKGLNSLVATLGERNDVLSDKLDDYKEAYRDLNNHYNVVINNTLNDLNIRLKAIEKRLSIKPFYAPTEDEKDED